MGVRSCGVRFLLQCVSDRTDEAGHQIESEVKDAHSSFLVSVVFGVWISWEFFVFELVRCFERRCKLKFEKVTH